MKGLKSENWWSECQRQYSLETSGLSTACIG